ncbi:MAG: glutaredoxin 3 [Bacillota bacterium]
MGEKKQPEIEIYTLEWCPYCRKAKSFFQSKGLNYKEYDIDDQKNKEEMIERSGGKKTVPQIFIKGQNIGGYDELIKLKSEEELRNLIDMPESDFTEQCWDLVIIGAGPAGLSAAIYAARKGLDVLLLSVAMGGQVIETDMIDNWIGTPEVKGQQLMQSFWEHAHKYNLKTELGERVVNVECEEKNHILELEDGKKVTTKAVLVCSGTQKRTLGVDGENKFKGKGVHYCAICDGFLYAGKDVAVIGGGNSGLEAALDLAKLDCKVSVVEIADHLQGDKVMQDKVRDNDQIDIYTSCKVTEISGDEKVDKMTIRETEAGEFTDLAVEAVFVEVGLIPNSGFICDKVETNSRNEIKVNENNEASIKGVYAAGDVTDIKDKQIIVSAAEGAKAALRVNEYLNS